MTDPSTFIGAPPRAGTRVRGVEATASTAKSKGAKQLDSSGLKCSTLKLHNKLIEHRLVVAKYREME